MCGRRRFAPENAALALKTLNSYVRSTPGLLSWSDS